MIGSKSNDLCMVNLRSKKVSTVPLPKRVVNEWEVSAVGTASASTCLCTALGHFVCLMPHSATARANVMQDIRFAQSSAILYI